MDPVDLETNRRSWDQRARLHRHSAFYDAGAVLAGQCTLHPPELALLAELHGLRVAHLQCHFGLDTLSLARRGAAVVGLDFSPAAVELARELVAQVPDLVAAPQFVCSDVYAAADAIVGPCDVVFTSYGVLGWLDDLDRWAGQVAALLKPGGALVLAEFHPVVWLFDDDFGAVVHPWSGGPIREEPAGSYGAPEAEQVLPSVGWNHGTADVLGALLRRGFQLEAYTEHRWSPFPCFRGTEEHAPGRHRIASLGDTIPMVYALRARKPVR